MHHSNAHRTFRELQKMKLQYSNRFFNDVYNAHMKIGIDARFFSSQFTGIGRYTYELIKHMAALDTRHQFVVFMNNPQFADFTPPNERWTKVLADTQHYSIKEQTHYARILNKADVDLIHFTHFNAPLLYRKPSIVTIHDLTLTLYPGAKMRSPLRRFAYQQTINSIAHRSKQIIAVSHKTKDDIVHFLRVSPHKISVIYEAASENFIVLPKEYASQKISDCKNQYAITGDYLLYTGVWRSHKNLINLLRAFSLLKNKYAFAGQLVITGKEDPYYPEVRATVASLQLTNAVRFTGLVSEENLVTLFNGALAYVLPSLYEGFGLPILEAFACGIPVACSWSSCLPEIAGEGNALLFDPHDPTDIAKKLSLLVASSELRSTLRERGLIRNKDFSWAKMARETLQLYEHCTL